ncbi:Uncharacterized protein HZ326_21673 [Fusarium oxysporum f. sp. albedinis]|nr:Uncharacterized protein HZ326_21673 [Fusarium oxysporum f. sp. albedinis]
MTLLMLKDLVLKARDYGNRKDPPHSCTEVAGIKATNLRLTFYCQLPAKCEDHMDFPLKLVSWNCHFNEANSTTKMIVLTKPIFVSFPKCWHLPTQVHLPYPLYPKHRSLAGALTNAYPSPYEKISAFLEPLTNHGNALTFAQ